MDPMTIMALMSIASAGYSMYSAEQQKEQAFKEMAQGKIDVAKKQSDLLAQQYKKRRADDTVLGQGSTASQAIADQGTILTSNPKTRSLLGG